MRDLAIFGMYHILICLFLLPLFLLPLFLLSLFLLLLFLLPLFLLPSSLLLRRGSAVALGVLLVHCVSFE
jgi:hypothetical protein